MSDTLRIGGHLDPETGQRTGTDLGLPADALTTHGVIVGMTGSGKTGLGVVLLEEILASGRPALILDPKGDLTNLALTFPELAPSDFTPWVDGAEARREGISVDELGERTAALWAKGLAGWGLDGDDLRHLRSQARVTIYTPGSAAGVGLDLVGSMAPPEDGDEESQRDAAEGLVTGLLTLADLDTDPLTSPEHILLSTLVMESWRAGETLTLEGLIGGVQRPPFRKLGVFELDTFFPERERTKLALRLNGLLASPTFAAWREGAPLEIASLLYTPEGLPRAAVVQLSHLSETERSFVATLILTRLIGWMRAQPGTSDLRALLYIDELFGFAPPTAAPPTKKPLLTLFKQARAHGLGVVVATQNPVDMDYKLLSNAGTWMVGRLQTERDKLRIVEGLKAADGSVDVGAWDARMTTLGKRHFVLKRARSPKPELFTSRWAMSYLRGPLTRTELERLPAEVRTVSAAAPAASRVPGERFAPPTGGEESASPAEGAPSGDAAFASPPGRGIGEGGETMLADDETPIRPESHDGVPVAWLDPAVTWGGRAGLAPGGRRLEAGVAVQIRLLFDETRADLRHTEELEAIVFPLPATPGEAAKKARAVDHDPRDFTTDEPEGARYVLPTAPIDSASWFRDLERSLTDRLHAGTAITLFQNPELKLWSRPDESREAFEARCLDAAEAAADEAVAAMRERYARRLETARDQAARAEARLRELEVDVSTMRQEELMRGAGALLGAFLGGRRRTRGLTSMASRRARTRRKAERLSSAEERLADEVADVAELESELAAEIDGIWEEEKSRATKIEPFEVRLEKNDIHVEGMRLFWGATGR